MFACLYLPPSPNGAGRAGRAGGAGKAGRGKSGQVGFPLPAVQPLPPFHALLALARDFSPRLESHSERLVTLDISGLDRLFGTPQSIGEALRRTAAERGLHTHVAIAATRTAALLLAQARAGLTVIAAGEEAAALAPLPLRVLIEAGGAGKAEGAGKDALALPPFLPQRWGLGTLGDLAAIPAAELSERLGQDGVLWQRWARGEDVCPLVPSAPIERFEESLDLEWPIDGLEPLSFVLGRLCEPLCLRLEQRDRGAVAFHLRLTLITREVYERSVQLPAPIRDARILRTLALLDLESHPPAAAIDRIALAVDVTEGRILQLGLFARALPAERLATLLARLTALMGAGRVGAPALVDSYQPGAFTVASFALPSSNAAHRAGCTETAAPGPCTALRRFRLPIPARVALDRGRPGRVTTDRRGFSGGRVEWCVGPWRTSGGWWNVGRGWNCDEWDVGLSDGATYRLSEAHDRGIWFLDGILD